MSDDLTPQGASAVRLARTIVRVRALHRRRAHSANGGTPSVVAFDFVAHGQTEFPDLCDHCRVAWPCATAVALGETL